MKKHLILAVLLAATNTLSAQTYQIPVSETDEPMQTGPFTPDWESLRTYEVPEWFRDAKFGIWAHWGPQCVEGSGDWMAREMYMEGNGKYTYHRDHYGHPSEDTVERLRKAGIPLFSTASCGAVSFLFDKGNLYIEPFLSGDQEFLKTVN